MKNDPIIEEIHRYRKEYAAKFDFDIKRMAADIQSREGSDGRPIFRGKPRRIKAVVAKRTKPA